MSKGALPGFRDFYPSELAERSHIMGVWREVARRFAFAEYDGPPLEPLELYTRKSGDEIVTQLYSFTDKGGREVSLRPEMTPTFARMVAARANALRKPVRWFSMPQLFRYERQQKGRLREHYQLNVDIVGEADVTADAELVAVAIEMMRGLGLTHEDVRVRVSDRRILQAYLTAVGVADEQHAAAFAVIDKLERQPPAVSEEKLAAAGIAPDARAAILRIPATTLDDVAAAIGSGTAAGHVTDFRRFGTYLAALTGDGAAWLRFDLSIVRGLAYYTGIVFELFDAKGEFRAIAGGGRYDNLLGALGGVDLPALGFGMGDVVLGELLRARGLLAPDPTAADLWVVAEEIIPIERTMAYVRELRGTGASVDYALRGQSASKQLKAADQAGVAYAVLLGPAFRDEGRVTVRPLNPDPRRGAPLTERIGATELSADDLVRAVRAHPGAFAHSHRPDRQDPAHG
ncbi:MAG: histidine--tRNA ligase [Gemmatimonadaceae bacterium]|nr:histidine--tRNA ligase [Gemmatimonadaceae bacterium]